MGHWRKHILKKLVDGDTYQYWSIINNDYNTAQFIITLPELSLEQCLSANNSLVGNFSITLEKSEDSVSSL